MLAALLAPDARTAVSAFSMAFACLAAQPALLHFGGGQVTRVLWVHSLRLLAFLLILAGLSTGNGPARRLAMETSRVETT
jgi:hypothetical protein